tara:strand:- start:1898 stop:2290 length:393 start_codon:yes stop_codon:yes gene_type:complete
MKIDLTFWLILSLTTSVTINFVAFYYARGLLNRLMFVGDNLSDLTQMITSYRNHLKAVYSMEMFYGDETLQHLIDHTKSLYTILEEFEDAYEIAIPSENSEEEQEEEIKDAETTIDQENVFYAGTRTSNN